MTKTITGSNKIIFRCSFNNFSNDGIQFIQMRICEKNRFYIGIIYPYMFHSVFFFIPTGQLMFFDMTVDIIIHTGTYNQAILCPAVHCLGIHIVFFHIILHQPTLCTKSGKVFSGFCIYFFIMFIRSRFKIYFRFDDMIQRHLISFSFRTGFFGVQYIIGP